MTSRVMPTAFLRIVIPCGIMDLGVAVAVGMGVGVMIGVILRGVLVGGGMVGVRVGVSVGGCANRMVRLCPM